MVTDGPKFRCNITAQNEEDEGKLIFQSSRTEVEANVCHDRCVHTNNASLPSRLYPYSTTVTQRSKRSYQLDATDTLRQFLETARNDLKTVTDDLEVVWLSSSQASMLTHAAEMSVRTLRSPLSSKLVRTAYNPLPKSPL